MSQTVLAHPRVIVANSPILSPGVGRALGEVVSLATLGKRVLITALGESMTEESMRVGAALGTNEARVFKVHAGSGITLNLHAQTPGIPSMKQD